MTFEAMLEQLHLNGGMEGAVLTKFRRDRKEIEEISKTAYRGEDFNFALCRRMPLTRLTVVVDLLLQKYDDYKAKGVSDGMIFDTFRDVSLRAKLYHEKTGRAGISKGDVIWFRHIMNDALFKIGSLQFQPFEMIYLDEETIGEPYMTFTKEQKGRLPAGTPVINCHVQRGADLNPDAVENSFQGAREFFSTHFRETYKAFLCYSWLLYPPMTRSLSPQSNIRRFADRFTILGAIDDPEQAMEYLFWKEGKKKLTADATTLQKLALAHGEQFGFACGIILNR